MTRIAFYGGSFDPVHNGHIAIAERAIELFQLDKFVFIPAFHAPHKKDIKPSSAYDRYAMLVLATNNHEKIEISKIELENPEKPYTIQTLRRIKNEMPQAEIFFVMGADSWQEITTWREWEEVLTIVGIIVVTRPSYPISFDHVTEKIRQRVCDIRGLQSSSDLNSSSKSSFGDEPSSSLPKLSNASSSSSVLSPDKIYITDIVQSEASATKIRKMIKEGDCAWKNLVPENVASYVVKYGLYLK